MTGVLGKFVVEHGIHGARIRVRSDLLTNNLNSDSQIDAHVQLLKDDLDACAREMKRLVAIDHRGSLFEGWPAARDDTLDA